MPQESFVTSAVEEMLGARVISILPKGGRPEAVSPLGVVPKGTEGKFTLIINMRYVNGHMVKKKFKFEGLKDLADLVEKEDHTVSSDLIPGCYHVELHPALEPTRKFDILTNNGLLSIE